MNRYGYFDDARREYVITIRYAAALINTRVAKDFSGSFQHAGAVFYMDAS